MSRKKMEELAKKLGTMYLTENPVNLNDEDYGYKYFICYHNTHTVVTRTKNIPDMIEALQELIGNGVSIGSGTFH
jgi:hypothetical protein